VTLKEKGTGREAADAFFDVILNYGRGGPAFAEPRLSHPTRSYGITRWRLPPVPGFPG